MMQIDFDELFKTSEKLKVLTKLFAEENIYVQFSSTENTASFNPNSRVLTFPYSVEMIGDDDISTVFMCHEVAHAFWTPGNGTVITDELNVIEDIRIERLLKNKYPGLEAGFYRGYKKLADKQFFGDIQKLAKGSFINRLNVYAKCGPITCSHIKFNEKEQDFLNRCFAAKTFEEVIELANELKELNEQSKDDLKNLSQEEIEDFVRNSGFEKPEESDAEDQDNDSDEESGENEEGELTSEECKEIFDQFLEEQSKNIQEEFDQKLKDSSVSGVDIMEYHGLDQVGDYLKADEFAECYKYLSIEDKSAIGEKYTQQFKKSVDYLAKEFDMKKAAAKYKSAKISRSGKLDLNRVHLYQVVDNIFLDKRVEKNGKNHGFIILLDGSGSIYRQFGNMVSQTILITEFARKVGIPFKVFVFGAILREQFTTSKYILHTESVTGTKQYPHNCFFEVLSSDQHKKNYYASVYNLVNQRGFTLNYTPTSNSMIYMEAIAKNFFDTNNISMKKMFLITDGQPTDCSRNEGTIFVDKKTKKIHKSSNTYYSVPFALSKMFKDRHDIDVVSLFLTTNIHAANSFLNVSISKSDEDKFKTKKFVKLESDGNSVTVIKPQKAIEEKEMNISGDMSIAKAATAFKNAISQNKLNTNLLNSLAEHFAV